MGDSMGTKEAAELWSCSQSTVQKWCREGQIIGACQDAYGSPWHIPKEAKPPHFIKISKKQKL